MGDAGTRMARKVRVFYLCVILVCGMILIDAVLFYLFC